MDKIETPNLDKLKEVESTLDEIKGFMDWLQDDRGILLAQHTPSYVNSFTGDSSREKFLEVYQLMTVQELLYDYAQINVEELEQEKRKIVETYMKKQESK